MSKKAGGLLTFLTGVAAGAAAVFLSKKENRVKTQKVVTKTSKQAKKLAQEAQENPQAFKKKVKTQGKKLAKKALSSSKTSRKATKPGSRKASMSKRPAKK